jgi:serine protease Do
MQQQNRTTRRAPAAVVAAAALGLFLAGSRPASAAGQAATVSETGMEKLEFREVINTAKARVFPAVVFIKCVSENYDSGKKVTQESSGSGVLISATGELLTNWHVVDKAVQVRCLLFDGKAMEARVVGADKDTDLALVQLDMPANAPSLPYAELGDSTQLSEGHFVMAMGAPWGLSRSISLGIVSCTRRFLPESSEYSLWLQTDAAISPGNSGGPLVSTAGEVIGINARGMMGGGGDMGFAIPSETIREILPQLRKQGKVEWSWTGIQLQPIKDFNRNVYFDGTEGVIVADTDPESPARAAGILPRDRIMSVGGKPANGLMEEDLPGVRRLLGLLGKDAAVKVEIQRDGKPMAVDLTPREKGTVQGEELDCPRWDLTLKAINQFETPDLYFHRKSGVFVNGVRFPGNAGTAGLQGQDVVLKIDNQPVPSLEAAKELHKAALANADGDSRVLFTVLRNGLMKQIVLDYSRDHSRE